MRLFGLLLIPGVLDQGSLQLFLQRLPLLLQRPIVCDLRGLQGRFRPGTLVSQHLVVLLLQLLQSALVRARSAVRSSVWVRWASSRAS